MPSVRKRLETLERSRPPRLGQAVDHVVVSQALHRLSTEELISLRDASADKQQGKVRELTEHELAALAAYSSALERYLHPRTGVVLGARRPREHTGRGSRAVHR